MDAVNVDALSRLVYVSSGREPFTQGALRELLQKARKRNAAFSVSGMLLHDRGSFFQVLEGPTHLVNLVFERISGDRRHHRLVKLIDERGVERAFAKWTMGFANVPTRDLIALPGCNDFFSGGHCYAELSPTIAKRLLGAFREGRFRAHLT